jgi:predicted permease
MIVLRVYEDLRYAIRLIVGNGTSTLAVFLSLTLGIAASTSMFGAVDAFLLRPIPVPQTDRILRITSVNQSSAVGDVSYLNFADLRQRATKFEALVSSHNIGIALDVHNGVQSRITLGQAVSADFFPMLRLPLTIGRGFRPEEDAVPGRDAVAVISYSMWQRDFGGSADVVGKTIQINRNDFTIIGVAPREFRGVHSMIHPDLYVPRMMAEVLADPGMHPLTDRTMATVEVYGRLKPGAGVDEARAELERIGAQLEQENPATNRKQSLAVYTQTGFAVTEDPEAFSAGILFLFIGALVLGIACVNVANLLLSLAPARTRETAVRLAMGAPRSRLIRQFVIESCIVSTAATAAGIGVSALVARFVRSLEIGTSLLPVTLDMRIDTRVALFAFGVGMGAGILSAIIPAVRCSRGNLNLLMRAADPRVARSRTPLRQLLVSAQVAFAAVVLVFAIGAIHSLS